MLHLLYTFKSNKGKTSIYQTSNKSKIIDFPYIISFRFYDLWQKSTFITLSSYFGKWTRLNMLHSWPKEELFNTVNKCKFFLQDAEHFKIKYD